LHFVSPRFQVQKDLLDAELELFKAQQEGADTEDIQKRVNHLKVEAAMIGVLPTSK
jgi:RNA-binding protein 26